MKLISLYLLSAFVSASIHASDFYVSTNGTGAGTFEAPWGLQTALSHPAAVLPGDTIWLRGGLYTGKFTSNLKGLTNSPITVRSYSNEWAVIDSGPTPTNRINILSIAGAWTTFRDFEVMSSDPVRVTIATGSYPGDIRRGEGISVRAPGTKLINLVVHDTSQGISVWSEAPDSEVYGCVIYNNGWQGPDRAHGHGIYSQNETGWKTFRDNIIFNQFEKGIQLYGSDAAELKNFVIEENVIFNNGILAKTGQLSENITIYGGTGPSGIVIRNNMTYGNNREGKLVIGGTGAKDLIFENNYVAHGARFRFWQTAKITGNTFVRDETMLELYRSALALGEFNWDLNTYFSLELRYYPFATYLTLADGTTTGRGLSFDQWRASTGHDVSSVYLKEAPTGTKIFVRTNAYEPGRGFVAVYNWDRRDTIDVDLSSLMAAGSTYEIRNAQNYLASPIATGTFRGLVTLPMTGMPVAPPVGVPPPPPTSAEFNVFVVTSKPPATIPPTDPPAPELPPLPEPPEPEPVLPELVITVDDQQILIPIEPDAAITIRVKVPPGQAKKR